MDEDTAAFFVVTGCRIRRAGANRVRQHRPCTTVLDHPLGAAKPFVYGGAGAVFGATLLSALLAGRPAVGRVIAHAHKTRASARMHTRLRSRPVGMVAQG